MALEVIGIAMMVGSFIGCGIKGCTLQDTMNDLDKSITNINVSAKNLKTQWDEIAFSQGVELAKLQILLSSCRDEINTNQDTLSKAMSTYDSQITALGIISSIMYGVLFLIMATKYMISPTYAK